MGASGWRPIGRVGLPELREARAQAHYAAQWLSRAAYAYIPAKDDYTHTNLGWRDALDGFATHPLKDGVRLGVKVGELALVLLDGDRVSAQFSLHGRTDRDARAWLGQQIGALKLDSGKLDVPPDYQMPEHAIGEGAAYTADGGALQELAAWFANADGTLGRAREPHAAQASPVRCWPHHFDIATLISLPDEGAKTGRSVNAGLSPGDHYYDEPYYYVSPWPYPDAKHLPPVPAPGHWHTHEFTAAVAPASRILQGRDPQAETERFVRAAVEGVMRALG